MELTKKDLEQVLDQRLEKQTKELKKFSEDQTESLARIISKTVAEPMEAQFRKLNARIDLKERVEKLETEMAEMKLALHLS